MRMKQLTTTELIFVAATRGLLGAGIGLLVADRLGPQQRRTAGWVLAGIGALSTIPLALGILRREEGQLHWQRPRLPFGHRDTWQETQLRADEAPARSDVH